MQLFFSSHNYFYWVFCYYNNNLRTISSFLGWVVSVLIALDSRESTEEKTQVSPSLYEIVTLSELVKWLLNLLK